jgi:hypothetical protein
LERDHATTERAAQDGGQELNLVTLLNILWRRRLIVLGLPALGLAVGLLYGVFGTRRWEATVTIRPGITAFNPDGGPHRQWQLKDITRWYEMRLYERELRRRLGLPSGSRQVIRAEFIAQGLQNLQGGDVITLWTTATSPELAAAILDTSVELFADFAEADTVSSQLKLTRDGLLLQMRNLAVQLQSLAGEEEHLELQLTAARAESLQVHAEDRRLALDLDRLARQLHYQEQRLASLRQEEPRLAADLAQLDQAVGRLAAGTAGRDGGAAEIPSWVRRDAILDGGTVLESLTRAKLQVQQALSVNRARQDSVAYAAEVNRLDHAKLEIHRENTTRMKLAEVGRKLGDLRIERDIKLPARRQDLDNGLDERRLKLATLSPVQRVGNTVVSERPVRPRTRRAVLILVLLGGTTGVVLGFVWDYLSAHRREIFRS